ncbi:phosphorylated adapter RNA export protein-like [Paramacrobiotus metropolitanus]|uniref:phosphorylated adapter RNA export protein-like n=1 Tax=Paramacrobiotus metropolitanus TaxID=2943436 RepID=UPI0024464C05|nr:phosphorylated adapter RNA export protein-like [Paramacrobiotus metropolitanus]XP_055345813.1 phosphorylated adapter RNA export protein-like [Paramacrobiotus metropolitanus]XP_055345814.1 phosphorylated adapter RNA export protein-like [Paramacrobiotus metropolitanus]
MASQARSQPLGDSDSEDGQISDGDIDDDGSSPVTLGDSTNPTESVPKTVQKRKRGNVWKNAVLEEDLTSSLSRVTTDDKTSKLAYMDLDAPSTSADTTGGPARKGRKGPKGRRPGQRGSRSQQTSSVQSCAEDGVSSTSGEVGAGDQPSVGGETEKGEKRKNVQVPRAKRRPPKTHFFSSYPDMNSPIEDLDTLDVAARKAVHQLKEKFNPWTITQIVSHLGNAEARTLLQLTKTIEENGGMLTKDGEKRRTAGGVFITMFKSKHDEKYGKDAWKTIIVEPPGGLPKKKNVQARQRALKRRAERRAKEAAEKGSSIKAESESADENPDETMESNESKEVKVEMDVVTDNAQDVISTN